MRFLTWCSCHKVSPCRKALNKLLKLKGTPQADVHMVLDILLLIIKLFLTEVVGKKPIDHRTFGAFEFYKSSAKPYSLQTAPTFFDHCLQHLSLVVPNSAPPRFVKNTLVFFLGFFTIFNPFSNVVYFPRTLLWSVLEEMHMETIYKNNTLFCSFI